VVALRTRAQVPAILLLADMAAPDLPAEKPDNAEVWRRCAAAVRRCFRQDCCPDLEKLEWSDLLLIRQAYSHYAGELLKKKREGAGLPPLETTPPATAQNASAAKP